MLYKDDQLHGSRMAGKQAKILSLGDVNDLLVFASCTRHPLRNRVIVLLAAKAGLRAVEIAKLTWDMVLDPTGDIGSVIELRDHRRQERQRPIDPGTPRSSPGPHRLSRSLDWHRTRHSIRARRADDAVEYRGLVQSRIPQHRSATAARRIPDGGRSSPGRRGSSTRPVVRCAMSSCSPVTGRSRRHNGTSTATPMCSASWSQ